jgi:toxin ParE1/3/4
MAYRIEFADRAARDLEALYVEKNAAESQAGSQWYNGLEAAVNALATYPRRCPAAPEARKVRRELRHLLYGKKPHVYRILYEVDERQNTVWVLAVRHGARRKLKSSNVKSLQLLFQSSERAIAWDECRARRTCMIPQESWGIDLRMAFASAQPLPLRGDFFESAQ